MLDPATLFALSLLLAFLPLALVAGCDCCGCTTICSDSFTRADNTDITTGSPCDADGGWSEVSGSWSISSNTLTTSSTNAEAGLVPIFTDGSYISVEAKGASGDKIRVWGSYDGTDGHFAEVTIGTTDGSICLYRRQGGVATCCAGKFLNTSAATYYTIQAYFNNSDGNFAATCNSVTTQTCVTPVSTTNNTALGTGSAASAIAFKNFVLQEYSQSQPACSIAPDCCAIGSDTFTRTNTSNIGSHLVKEAGTSAISSNVLALTANNTKVRFIAGNPDSPSQRVRVNVKGANDNDQIRVFVDWLDSSNYHYVQIITGASKTLKIYEVDAGVTTELASTAVSTTAGSTYALDVCLSSGIFIQAVLGSARLSAPITAQSSIGYCGLACGTITTQVSFTDLVVDRGTDGVRSCPCGYGNDCSECPTYAASATGMTPAELVLVVAGITNGSCASCANLNGIYILEQKGSPCFYDHAISPSVCATAAFNLIESAFGFFLHNDVSANIIGTGQFGQWIDAHDKTTCFLNGWVIPETGSTVSGDCNFASSTVTVYTP